MSPKKSQQHCMYGNATGTHTEIVGPESKPKMIISTGEDWVDSDQIIIASDLFVDRHSIR